MDLSGNSKDSVAPEAPLSPTLMDRFRDVTPATEDSSLVAKGVIQWTEAHGARIVQTSDRQMLHGTLALQYFQDEGRLLGYTVYAEHVLIYESSTSQAPAQGDKEWLRAAIKGTPLENKLVVVEYESNDGKIKEQIHP